MLKLLMTALIALLLVGLVGFIIWDFYHTCWQYVEYC